MSDQDRPESTGTAPTREPQRESISQQQQYADQQRVGSQNLGGRRGLRRRHGGREGQSQQSSQSSRAEASLNMDELRELFSLIASEGFTEFELEKEGFRVRLRRDLAPQSTASAPQPQVHSTAFAAPQIAPAQSEGASASGAQASGGVKTPEAASEAELFKITSPIVGTFYRAASPTAEPFMKVGSHVDPDSVVCIIEAMKLMNEILAETTGTVEKVYVENGQPVEFGQPLFGIRK
ncbi:MAG: acetyl-CoA carboxylase biotin carboxyl carrier protein [Acidobacteriota bacterium]|nr:acetyl-CoA carboxylase biotin carboxyl carrier protein [Acidobacteriota bacterium]